MVWSGRLELALPLADSSLIVAAMLLRTVILLVMIAVGAIFAKRVQRHVLVAVVVTMSFRVVAYFAANVFGLTAVKPLSIGPYDPTNVIVGALFALPALWAESDVLLATRVATGGAFVLAGLGNAFYLNQGVDYFVSVGYPKTFHLFIMTAEVLGGAALLLPSRWLTLAVIAGLTVDMFGALSTQVRVGQPLDAAAFAMLFRLALLAMMCLRGRRLAIVGAGAVACATMAIVGGAVLAGR